MVHAPVAPPASNPSPARARDPWFDNTKMLLVMLVFVGHAWTLMPLFGGDQGSATAKVNDRWVYHALYAWHIPAFVIVTGYLSKSFEFTRARMWSLVTTVGVPYVVFEGALVWFRHTFGGVEFKLVWANPHWPMWYLSALFFWRLLTPLFKRMPAKVVVAVAISLVAGMFATDIFDNARIFGLLPFYVLGLKMHEGHWALLRTRRARWYGAAVLVLIAVGIRFADALPTEWYYWRSRYDVIGTTSVQQAFVIRIGMLLLGLAGAFAFFAVVPRGKSWFSALGGATLVVYLFHGFVVLSAQFLGFKSWAAQHWPLSLLVTTLAAVLFALVLAAGPVSRRLNYLVDPVNSWISSRTRWRPGRSA